MPQTFFDRLREYYAKVANVLRGEADAASVFPNPTDIGISREKVYAEFLKQHAPSKCNVFLGGFIFDEDGAESKQLDVIITTDTAPRFNFHNKDGTGKSFSPIEGTLGAVSVKSMLNRNELFNALGGIASIPPTRSLQGRKNPYFPLEHYDDWPAKIIYATKGIEPETLKNHLDEYYNLNASILVNRRPHFIHVAGSCLIFRAIEGMSLHGRGTSERKQLDIGTFYVITENPDVQAIVWVLDKLQQNASSSTQITFFYAELINKIGGLL